MWQGGRAIFPRSVGFHAESTIRLSSGLVLRCGDWDRNRRALRRSAWCLNSQNCNFLCGTRSLIPPRQYRSKQTRYLKADISPTVMVSDSERDVLNIRDYENLEILGANHSTRRSREGWRANQSRKHAPSLAWVGGPHQSTTRETTTN